MDKCPEFKLFSPENISTAVVIMGVSGAGKSTVGEMLAKVKGCRFLDGDDFHPESNKEKMKKGIPLTDEDRFPWLELLRDVLSASLASGESVVLACSALKRCYREILRSADPHYKSLRGECDGVAAPSPSLLKTCVVKFVLLQVKEEVLVSRVEERGANRNHFMPAQLLQSQLDLLEIDDDESEAILMVDATKDPNATVNTIIRHSLIF